MAGSYLQSPCILNFSYYMRALLLLILLLLLLLLLLLFSTTATTIRDLGRIEWQVRTAVFMSFQPSILHVCTTTNTSPSRSRNRVVVVLLLLLILLQPLQVSET